MKTGLLQILYANPFACLDYEDQYTHLMKFYEILGTLGASEDEEDMVYYYSCFHTHWLEKQMSGIYTNQHRW